MTKYFDDFWEKLDPFKDNTHAEREIFKGYSKSFYTVGKKIGAEENTRLREVVKEAVSLLLESKLEENHRGSDYWDRIREFEERPEIVNLLPKSEEKVVDES